MTDEQEVWKAVYGTPKGGCSDLDKALQAAFDKQPAAASQSGKVASHGDPGSSCPPDQLTPQDYVRILQKGNEALRDQLNIREKRRSAELRITALHNALLFYGPRPAVPMSNWDVLEVARSFLAFLDGTYTRKDFK